MHAHIFAFSHAHSFSSEATQFYGCGSCGGLTPQPQGSKESVAHILVPDTMIQHDT